MFSSGILPRAKDFYCFLMYNTKSPGNLPGRKVFKMDIEKTFTYIDDSGNIREMIYCTSKYYSLQVYGEDSSPCEEYDVLTVAMLHKLSQNLKGVDLLCGESKLWKHRFFKHTLTYIPEKNCWNDDIVEGNLGKYKYKMHFNALKGDEYKFSIDILPPIRFKDPLLYEPSPGEMVALYKTRDFKKFGCTANVVSWAELDKERSLVDDGLKYLGNHDADEGSGTYAVFSGDTFYEKKFFAVKV